MTELKLSRKDNAKWTIKHYTPKVLTLVIAVAVIVFLVRDLYEKREAIAFAYMNPKQTVEAKESYLKELETAQTNYASNLSRSYIQN